MFRKHKNVDNQTTQNRHTVDNSFESKAMRIINLVLLPFLKMSLHTFRGFISKIILEYSTSGKKSYLFKRKKEKDSHSIGFKNVSSEKLI